jgi:crossover junction endodeoxyribonuclease RusA
MITLRLPFPPSVNRYWRHPSRGPLAGRHLISQEGRAYRDAVRLAVLHQRAVHGLEGQLRLTVHAHPPDLRRRDLDNLLKALLDAMAHAGVVEDDSQFFGISIWRMAPAPPDGHVNVTIEAP